MALQFYTGFDYYDQTQTQRIWSYSAGGNSLVPGRFGGRGWVFNNENGYLSTVLTNSSTFVVGMAMYYAYGNSSNPFLVFQDATASRTSPITQVDLRLTADGAFQFTRNGTILATSPSYVFTFNAWNYIEVKVYINNSTGYVQLKVNGQSFLNVSSLKTQNSGNNYVNMVRVQPHSSSGSYQFQIDDLYILDDQGAAPQNDFIGECRIQTQWPSANGDTNLFQVVGALSNYQAVDETISDDDLTYVKSGTVGNIDDYAMGTVNMTGTIYGVQVNLTYRKDDVGVRTITPIIKSSGTFYEGSVFTCMSNYNVASKIWPLEPHANAAWTNTSVNALAAGIKIKG